MTMSFSPGQLVELKSGGPVMTIGSINDDGTAVYFWFDDATLRQEAIPLAALEPSDVFLIIEGEEEDLEEE